MVHGCAYFVRGISVLEIASLHFWFSSLVHGCSFFVSNGYNLKGRNDFSTVLLMNSDQLYMLKFS